jgi:lipid II:glycine glycyltransferase (peptidoglycan interpeptide bridge formation enzyme)
MVGDEYGWIGGFDHSGKLKCVLPYTVIRKAAIRMVRFRVETIPFGDELDIQEEKLFLNSAVQYFRLTGADMIIPATTNTIFRTYPDSAIAAPYGTYIIDLRQSEETLWGNLHSKHRNVVRNAIKKGVEIRAGIEYLDTAYELIRDTLRRSKLRFMSYKAFENFILSLGENIKVFVAEYQGIVQGCAVIPFSGYSAYYLYGGSISNPLTGATNFLQWEALRIFQNLGVKRYDFVGVRVNPEKKSKQEGIMTFKQRFGGRLVQGYMWKYPLHSLKYAVYSLAVRLARGGDIVDQELHKLKCT